MTDQPASTQPVLHFVEASGSDITEMRSSVCATPLYGKGDCKLIWVSESDLLWMLMNKQAKDCTHDD